MNENLKSKAETGASSNLESCPLSNGGVGSTPALTTNVNSIKDGVRPGELTILVAKSSAGKSLLDEQMKIFF